ncbi:hypothetical protein BO82DRAFT_414754 [Aspergillus uvarum CBS 121591]|uniref:Lysine-specific metallo-endopeptidase domain-containing protein n=1 Tax=Aspergillus uvarum CBS 121591 TaxID=1448315 RepID=A0A319CER4_9EURO|nr:hypothetical protein BO82DRAFT_414754 [Aspergillus uvarum CBS 121591]PYH81857.1 hypothetical protein BO82DRAFT_414754 [Aspergillus uvarum CBS 121591]
MRIPSFLLFGLFAVPVLTADPALTTLFVVKDQTDDQGGCMSKIDTLQTWLTESRTLVASGLKAISDAQDSSATTYNVARRYLAAHFQADPSNADALATVQGYLTQVSDFLSGKTTLSSTPRLYCSDTWLTKLSRDDVAWDSDGDVVMQEDGGGVSAPIAIEDVDEYDSELWRTQKNGKVVATKNVPYWSADLKEYVFDVNYNGKTYCTSSAKNLGATQDQTIPSTITLCPSAFTKTAAVATLGAKTPAAGMAIGDILPRGATFYHELFHLVLGTAETPDLTYSWVDQQNRLKEATTIPDGDDENYGQLVRRNPESYVFFSVGYWYFQQTTWNSDDTSKRWAFQSGAGELVKI